MKSQTCGELVESIDRRHFLQASGLVLAGTAAPALLGQLSLSNAGQFRDLPAEPSLTKDESATG